MQLELNIPTPCAKYLPEATLHVLNQLELHGRHGINIAYFPLNFALRSRISNLRHSGYKITTVKNNGELTRYILLGRDHYD